jgi:hypothetical protein
MWLRDGKMLKRFALGLVIVTVVLGIVFIGLNILDIDEEYRLHLPIARLRYFSFWIGQSY